MSRLLLILLCAAIPGVLVCATEPDPLFQSTELLDITITGPFALIDGNRKKDEEYTGTLSYTDATGQQVVLDVKLEVRGNWRLEKENCRYSQLWVDFRRRQTPGTLFENQNRLKLVVQCGRRNSYADYIIKEYQAYRLFGEITEYQLDTRLVNATYIESDRSRRGRTHFAFFIEHQKRLAARFNLNEVELNRISSADLNQQQSTLLSLFMYLIANTDYSIIRASGNEECCHNTKLLQNEDQEYLAIPYDFDSSGYVDTNYAAPPDPALRISRNTRRLYRGFCVPRDTLDSAINIMQASRDRFKSIVGDTTYTSERTADRSLRFVEDFFEIIDDRRKIERLIVRACRG
ncbi:MAG: hypothetical protein IIC60_10675 [Proteobacteria bacterium]|nr:hypothetical protein [Pseudomonadota bacterium]